MSSLCYFADDIVILQDDMSKRRDQWVFRIVQGAAIIIKSRCPYLRDWEKLHIY